MAVVVLDVIAAEPAQQTPRVQLLWSFSNGEAQAKDGPYPDPEASQRSQHQLQTVGIDFSNGQDQRALHVQERVKQHHTKLIVILTASRGIEAGIADVTAFNRLSLAVQSHERSKAGGTGRNPVLDLTSAISRDRLQRVFAQLKSLVAAPSDFDHRSLSESMSQGPNSHKGVRQVIEGKLHVGVPSQGSGVGELEVNLHRLVHVSAFDSGTGQVKVDTPVVLALVGRVVPGVDTTLEPLSQLVPVGELTQALVPCSDVLSTDRENWQVPVPSYVLLGSRRLLELPGLSDEEEHTEPDEGSDQREVETEPESLVPGVLDGGGRGCVHVTETLQR